MRWLLVLAACFCSAAAVPVAAQDSADGVPLLLGRLERALLTADPSQLPALMSPYAAPDLAERIATRLIVPGATRVAARERERVHLDGALPGDGFRLVVEVMVETGQSARIVTMRLDVRRAAGDTTAAAWHMLSAQVVTVVEGLFRLDVAQDHQFAATNFVLASEDLELTLVDGTVFPVVSERGTTAYVLLGRGQMRFTPQPKTEQQQVQLFAGEPQLVVPFDAALVKVNPEDAAARSPAGTLTAVAVDPRQLRRARDLFAEEAPRSFNLDLGDLSPDTWYLIPPKGDLLAEVHTRGRGVLTYARSVSEAEDVVLFERARGRDIARYSSASKRAAIGRFYNEDDLSDFEVLDYDIDATVNPDRASVDARARLHLRVRAAAMGTLSVRLAEGLTVTRVTSLELGLLTHLRIRGRDTVVVNLPFPLQRGTEVTVHFTYAGRVRTQSIDQEGLQAIDQVPIERSEGYYLLSSRAYWYPQPASPGYAPAILRITVPDGFTCVATGESEPGFRTAVSASGAESRVYGFRARQQVRYLSLLIARLRTGARTTVSLTDPLVPASPVAAGIRSGGRASVVVEVQALAHLQGRGRELGARAADILRFYAGLMGDAPYPSLEVAVVEANQPGGHSPAYFVMLHSSPPGAALNFAPDPAAFRGYPEFVLAHELAHQWWGQAVGWKNYREQWISEGFAQYFSALYAERLHGPEAFEQMLRQFRRWALDASDQGPIHLGYRLGQIKGDRQVFRAILYNKGAGVLHMLRRLIGDEAFFRGFRRLYAEHAFRKIGADDVRRAFEVESGRSLERFFDRWVFESGIPRLKVTSTIGDREVLVRLEQRQPEVYDLPVTLTLVYADGRQEDVVVPVTEAVVERRLPSTGPVRSVRVNRDGAALAEFEE